MFIFKDVTVTGTVTPSECDSAAVGFKFAGGHVPGKINKPKSKLHAHSYVLGTAVINNNSSAPGRGHDRGLQGAPHLQNPACGGHLEDRGRPSRWRLLERCFVLVGLFCLYTSSLLTLADSF